ncbi:VOC family protein [Streptomyces sp. JNUCC 63]
MSPAAAKTDGRRTGARATPSQDATQDTDQNTDQNKESGTMAAVGEIHHVAVNVTDMEASLRFYRDGLGLRKTLEMPVGNPTTWRTMALPEGTTGKSVFLQGPTRIGQLELLQWDLPVPRDSRPKRAGDPGPCVLSFSVSHAEVHEVYQRLQDMGVHCYTEPTTNTLTNYGPVTLFFCEDPDGNQVEVIALPTQEEVRAFRAATMKPDPAGTD